MDPNLEIFLKERALNIQTQIESQLSLREKTLESRLSILLKSINKRLFRIKDYEKQLHRYEKDLKSLCFATIDDFETRIKELEILLNNETTNLLTSMNEKIAISVSNTYCSLLQELKDSFSNTNTSLGAFDFSTFRPHFFTIFNDFDIDLPKEFLASAESLESAVTQCFQAKIKDISIKQEMPSASFIKKSERTNITEEDDIDKKLRMMDEKVQKSNNSQNKNKKEGDSTDDSNSNRSKSQINEGNRSKGFFSKMKSIFSRKNEEGDLGAVYTEMKLGDEAKFRYDPVKKKYIFEGEEEEKEEIIPPPLMTKSNKQEATPLQSQEKQDNERDSLLKPPSRSYLKKKPAEKIVQKQEKFTSFNQKDIGLEEKPHNIPVEKKNKVKYSEGISLHFERLVKNMKEKIQNFIDKPLVFQEFEGFYSTNLELQKFLEDFPNYFQEKIIEIREFLTDNLENHSKNHLLEKKNENHDKFEEEKELLVGNIKSFEVLVTEKTKENIKLQNEFINLQTRFFGLLNDNLHFLISSQEQKSLVVKGSSHEKGSFQAEKINYESELFRNEENLFLRDFIEGLLKRIEEKIKEKKALSSCIEALIQKSEVLTNIVAKFQGILKEKNIELQRKMEEIKSLNHDLHSFKSFSTNKTQELTNKIHEISMKNSEIEEKYFDLIKKFEDFQLETKENYNNVEEFLLKSDEITKFYIEFQLKEDEIIGFMPNFSNFPAKITFFIQTLFQKIIQNYSVKQKNNILKAIAQENERFETEKSHLLEELDLKSQEISSLTRKISVLEEKNIFLQDFQKRFEEEKEISKKLNIENLKVLSEKETLEAEISRMENEKQIYLLEKAKILTEIEKKENYFIEEIRHYSESFKQVLRDREKQIYIAFSKENENILSQLKSFKNENQDLIMEKLNIQKENQSFIIKLEEISNTNQFISNENLKLSQENENLISEQTKIININEELVKQIELFQKENEELKKQIQNSNKEKSDLLIEINNILQRKEVSFKENQDLLNENQNLLKKNEELEFTIKKVSKENNDISESNKNLESIIKDIEIEKEKLLIEVSQFSKERDYLINEKANMVTNLNNFSQENSQLIKDLKEISQSYQEMQRKFKELKDHSHGSKEENESLIKENKKLIGELEKMKEFLNENSSNISYLNEEIDKLKEENEKMKEEIEKTKEENEKLSIFVLKHNDCNGLKESLEKEILELKEEKETNAQENAALNEKIIELTENQLKTLENSVFLLSKENKELRKENEILKEENHGNTESLSGEVETLRKTIERKSKKIEALETNEKELSKNLEIFKSFETKYKETEEFNTALLKEKRQLFEENNRLYEQLSRKDFYQEIQNLKQKMKDLEEEKSFLKANNSEIVEKMQSEILNYKEILEKMKGNLPSEKPKDEKIEKGKENEDKTSGKSGGIIYNIASFFLTEKEMKGVQPKK